MAKPDLIEIGLTGSTGFVGQNFIQLLDGVYNIKRIDLRKSRPSELNLSTNRAVVHCAALVHQMQGAQPEEYFRVNTKLTEELASAAKRQGVPHFIFLSTSHVYGDYGNCFDHTSLFDEDSICRPTDPYGESKLEAERILLAMQSETFRVSIIRSPMIYGRGAKGNLLKLSQLLKVCPLLPFGAAKNQRSIIYIENLIHFIRLTIDKKTTGLLLAQDKTTLSITQIMEYLAAATSAKVVLFRLPKIIFKILYALKPKIMQRLYGTLAMDSRRTNEKLGYEAPISSAEGFRRMMQP